MSECIELFLLVAFFNVAVKESDMNIDMQVSKMQNNYKFKNR